VRLVDAAAEDLDLGLPACLLAGAGAAAWIFCDAVSRTIARWGISGKCPVNAD
jgi:hypothetical protein